MPSNRNLKILLFGGCIWYFAEGMFGPLVAIFTQQIGGDLLNITWAWATYLMVAGLLFIVVGKITDKFDNKEKIMVLGYALNALFTFGYAFINSPHELIFVQAGLGVAAALATPTWNSLYAKYEDKGQDGYEWGIAGGSAMIITGVSILIGGYIVEQTSFQILFLIMGVIQVIATLCQAKILFYDNVDVINT